MPQVLFSSSLSLLWNSLNTIKCTHLKLRKKRWVLTNKHALEIPLCSFSSLTCFPFTPHAHLTPGNHFSDLHHHGLALSTLEPHINRVMWYAYILLCLVSLAEHIWESFTLLHVSEVHSFLLFRVIPLNECTTVCLSSSCWLILGLLPV